MSNYTSTKDWCVPVSGIKYRVTKPLIWYIGVPQGRKIVVPVGRLFDVSVPKGLRWLFNPHNSSYLKAAALHDEMLHHCEPSYDRITSASQFHQALKADGVSVLERLPMLLGVQLFKYD